jgi:hypothetical protein
MLPDFLSDHAYLALKVDYLSVNWKMEILLFVKNLQKEHWSLLRL